MTSPGRPTQGPVKKTVAQKTAAQKPPAQKTPARKAARPAVKKPAAQRVPVRKGVATKPPAKKAASSRVPVARKAPARSGVPRQPTRAATTASRSAAPPRGVDPPRRSATSTGSARPSRPARPARPPRAPRPPRPPRRPLFPAARVGDPNRRLRFTLVLALVVLIVFGGRLVQLQGLNGSAVAATALARRQTSVALTAHRGDILDRTGATLATTVDRRNITVDQRLVPAFGQPAGGTTIKACGECVQKAAAALSPIVGMPVGAVLKRIAGDRPFAYLVKDVEPAVWRQVARLDIPGVLSQEASRRTYPAGQVGANVVGFLNSTGAPQGGIESAMQSELKGTDGKLTYERGSGGQQIATGLSSESDPVAGRDVQLTIDRDLTWKAQQLLAAQVKATGSESGQLVAMNPKTGAIYAMVSVPTFDPNDPGQTPIANLSNSAVSDVFEPGSTSKVITAAAALEEGKATLATKLLVDGEIRRGGRIFHDSHDHGPEKLTFAGVLAQSSNVGTIRVGEMVPAATMYSYLRKFGLGSRTGVGLGESAGILAPVDDWNNSQRYTVLFGQGLSVTAVQSASVFATIANNGVRVTPRVIQAVSGPDGQLDPVKPAAGTRVISQQTATTLRTALERVVSDDGTAIQASVPGYRVAGKTGTAQAYDDACSCYRYYTASFVGMAPADDPQLVVAVYLQKAKHNYFGGTSAAPVFQQVMTYALARLGIEPTGTTPPKVPQTWK